MTLGPKSNELQHLRRLSGRRRSRLDAGQFVVDGPVLVAEALESDIVIDTVYVEASADEPELLALATDQQTRIVAVQDGALAKVTSPVTPQGVAALASIPAPPPFPSRGLVLVLVDVADPGNAGTLVRTAEAAGASGVVFAGDSVDPWSPKVVRASAGSIFRTPIVVAASVTTALDALAEAPMQILATVGSNGIPYDEVELGGDIALLLGNEAHGLAPEVVGRADLALTIPMSGRVESLNVAMAGCVLAMTAASYRRRTSAEGK